MIRLGGKFENVLVSQVKVLKQALWTSTVHDLSPSSSVCPPAVATNPNLAVC
jgi:hypothetical protein